MGILSSLLGIGQSAPTPVAPQTIQTTELSKEVAPFMKDLLEKGQALYKTRTEEGFQPYTGQTLAELSPEQIQARAGLTGLVGSQAPQFAKAQELTEGVAQQMTPELAQQYMSPYQQAVTDLDKAEAQKTFERDVLPKVRQAQIGAGAFGGTRGTMLEAQALADQQKLVGDIQTRGSQSAYQDAIRSFEAQKQREGSTGQALANLAPAAFKAQTGELGLLEQIGKEDQMRSQSALDESYKQYLQERVFPEQTLGQYQSVIAGFPSASTTRTTTTAPQPQQSGLGSLLGGALNAANIYGTFGGFTDGGFGSAYMKRAEGGPVISKAFGGRIGEGGFLGMTADGQNLWQKTQEGITNRSIHGGVVEGEGTSTETLGAMQKASPAVIGPVKQSINNTESALSSRRPPTSNYDYLDIPDTLYPESRGAQTTQRMPDGTIPFDLYTPKMPVTFGQGFDLKDVPYLTANRMAQDAGADRFIYNDEYAGTAALPDDYDVGVLGTQVYRDDQLDRVNYTGTQMGQGPGPVALAPNPNSEFAMRAKGYTRNPATQQLEYSPNNTLNRRVAAAALVPTQAGVQAQLKHGGKITARAGGGLMSLPTMYRAVGTEGAGPFTLPNVESGLPEGITYDMLSKMPPNQQRAILTGNLYNIYQQEQDRATTDKARIEAELAKEELDLDKERQLRKSSAIGNMLGSFARGMKKGAGQGFGGELLSGLEEGATSSTEISKEDRKVLNDAEDKLTKDKKEAAALWDKGNKDKALQLLNIANQNYSLKLEELKIGYTKMNERTEAIKQLSTLSGNVKDEEFKAIANNYIAQGLFKDIAEINSIMSTNITDLPNAKNKLLENTLEDIQREDNNIELQPLPDIVMTSPGGGA
jgi:hypothetical protein|tara:strand:- start:2944 stop:5553 length:2610 start_codon:yes stop_codon:yes gene_type:complete